MDLSNFYASLEVMGKGMLGVFIVIVCIMLCVVVFNKIFKSK